MCTGQWKIIKVPGTSEWIEGIPFFVFYGAAFPCEPVTWIGRFLLSQLIVLYLIVILRLNENGPQGLSRVHGTVGKGTNLNQEVTYENIRWGFEPS